MPSNVLERFLRYVTIHTTSKEDEEGREKGEGYCHDRGTIRSGISQERDSFEYSSAA